jgi:hypothetical protein
MSSSVADGTLLIDIVRDLASQLGSSKPDPDTLARMEASASASAFVLCYRRYGTPAVLFEIVFRDFSDQVLRVGYWRFIFFWVKLRFRTDFYGPNRLKRRLFNTLVDTLFRYRRTEMDAQEGNRILLLLNRYGQQYSRRRSRLMKKGGIGSVLALRPSPSMAEALVADKERAFWNYEPRDVAEQITLIEANMFRSIRQEEFYRKGWQDPTQGPVAHLLIARSNSISAWVASNILCQSSPAARSRALARFVVVAQMLEEMGNYNSLVAILGGFKLWTITRLQGVISLRKDYRLLLSNLESLLTPDGNYKHYRAILAARHDRPTVPYLGLYLKDLTFIEDGNQDHSADGKINRQKIGLFGNVMRDIVRFQRSCAEYNKRIVTRHSSLLDHLARLPRMTDEEMNTASLIARPTKSAAVVESLSQENSTKSSCESGGDSDSSEMKEQLYGGDSSGVSHVLRFLPTPRDMAMTQ